jgi:Ca2+-binding RTX toxin-like protein
MPTLIAPAASGENFVISPDGTRVYVAGNDGVLRVYNSSTGVLLASYNVGRDLDAITISRDGRYAIITENVPVSTSQSSNWTSNETVSAVYQVDLRSGYTQIFTYRSTGSDYVFGDVAYTDDNTVLLSQRILPGWSGWAPLVTLNLSNGTFAPHGSYYTGFTTSSSLTQAANPGDALVGQLGLSSAEYFTIGASGNRSGTNGLYSNGVQGYAQGIEAFAGTGSTGRIAIVTGGGLYLYNGSFGYLANLATIYPNLGTSPGVAFSADGQTLYAIDRVAGQIIAIAMDDYFAVQRIPLTGYNFSVLQWGNELTLSPDGLFLLVATSQGAVRVERPTDNIRTNGDDNITGTAVADELSGGPGNDVLFGLAGDDLLAGGIGSDQLHGGAGNDDYLVDTVNDIVFEDANDGIDTVFASSDFYLHANVEDLVIENAAGAAFGVGNELGNWMLGNTSNNLLIGWGGADTIYGEAGNDQLFGGDGNDQLFGEAGIDYIVGGLGDDRIDGGMSADEIYGQDGDDIIGGGTSFDTDIMVGGSGNDTIYGDSGRGDYDLMHGNVGNDSFYVDTPADLVFEQVGEGNDTVYADIIGAGYYLYDNIENLVLAGNTPFGVGNALDNSLTGNAGGNWLLGGAGNDRLNGMAGGDVLFGEGGSDIFIFARGTGGDVVGDFVRGQDRIDVSAFGLSFAQLQARFVQNGAVGAINLGNGDVVVLHNVTMSQLTASDFILAPVAEAPPKIEADSAVTAAAFAEHMPTFADNIGFLPNDVSHRWATSPWEVFV